MADFVEPPLRRADAVLQDAVAHHQFLVVAVDAQHLGREEEIGKQHVGDRDQDETDEDFADQAVGAQAERYGHHLLRGRDDLVGKLVQIECGFLVSHRKKLPRIGCEINVNYVILQPD